MDDKTKEILLDLNEALRILTYKVSELETKVNCLLKKDIVKD